MTDADPDAEDGEWGGPSSVDDGFKVDVDVYAGPLDLLVELVRRKKIDVAQVPVLTIVEQFLDWIRTAMDARLETAADWLLMAATLTFLKSRLLLPASRDERSQAETAVEDFMARLRRMQAVRDFADSLQQRRRLGLHWHEPSALDATGRVGKRLETTLYAMLSAYVQEAKGTLLPPPSPIRRPHVVYPVSEAVVALRDACTRLDDWTSILDVLPRGPAVDRIHARSRIASTYVASLELAKRGELEVRQSGVAVSFLPARRPA